MRSRRALATLLLPGVLAVAACGDSDEEPTASTGTQSTASGTSTATPEPETASPELRLEAAADALAETKGFHLEGTATDEDGPGELEGDIRQDGSLRVLLRQAGGTIELRLIDGKAFLKADRTFYLKDDGSREAADLLADKWVTGPAKELGGAELERFKPETLGYCLTQQNAKLEDAGTGEVEGTPVTKVRDAGGEPGTAPGTVSIAAEGEPLPLRIEQTGRQLPGGRRDPRCESEEESTSTAEDVVLSDFGADSPIEAPTDAIDLEELAQQGSGGTATS